MQHLDEGTIHAWLDGELSADEVARVELHVASCETCSDSVAEARGLIAASTRILTALDDVPRVSGARGDRRDRGSRGWFLVRSRIAAVVALVVAGGALALAVRRDTIHTVALESTGDRGSDVALVAIDSPAAELTATPSAEGTERLSGDGFAGRGTVGAAKGGTPAQASVRERDLASAPLTDAAPPTLAQLEVRAAAAPPAAPPARTDDTARVAFDVAAANRITTEERQVEAQSSVTEKVAGALGARRSVAQAPARFAEPVAPQARLQAADESNVPRPLTEERMVEQDGRVVVRRIYRVDEILVTLDERGPMLEFEQRRAAEQVERAEERLRRVEERASPVETDAAARIRADSVSQPITTIRWVDARGAEFTLSGAASTEQLERIRKLLGY